MRGGYAQWESSYHYTRSHKVGGNSSPGRPPPGGGGGGSRGPALLRLTGDCSIPTALPAVEPHEPAALFPSVNWLTAHFQICTFCRAPLAALQCNLARPRTRRPRQTRRRWRVRHAAAPLLLWPQFGRYAPSGTSRLGSGWLTACVPAWGLPPQGTPQRAQPLSASSRPLSDAAPSCRECWGEVAATLP